MSLTSLSPHQAYLAMYAFLEQYHARGQSPEIAILLGALAFLPDGRPADPAMLDDWNHAVQRSVGGEVKVSLVLR